MYKTNALPLYVIADHEGNPLNTPCRQTLMLKSTKNGSTRE